MYIEDMIPWESGHIHTLLHIPNGTDLNYEMLTLLR